MSKSQSREFASPGFMDEVKYAELIKKGKEYLIQKGYHGPSIWQQIIAWQDHDEYKHVNNVHYARYIESNRTLFYHIMTKRLKAEKHKQIMKMSGNIVVLTSVLIRFKRPIVYPDTILIARKPVLPIEGDTFTVKTIIYSLTQQAEVATGEDTLVSFDQSTMKKCPIDDDIREATEYAAKNPNGDIISKL